ncbi:MAG: leucine--tRNA ligase [Candidatus Pacebacteria bacterium]|nr:leucine--tRNA ligase [Candidatus Paceibacterota bacterium]
MKPSKKKALKKTTKAKISTKTKISSPKKVEAYDHLKIEKKWQKVWDKTKIYKTQENKNKPKAYVLDMFPYPSGTGLHVGHPRGYIATDSYSRFKTMKGFNVLHPMGWDAFGLPAEEFALKNKVHPSIAVKTNVKRFKEQLSILGLNYDWSREINTTDPEYYKWTQWAFLQMHKKGLTHESHEPINWCPSCKTGLANEDLEDGKCERCGSVVEQKPIRQWIIKITKYADRLLKDIDALNWPESIKESQRNWIGRSEGAEFDFKIKVDGYSGIENTKISVFTTRADTLFGVTYVVLAPEHKLVNQLLGQSTNKDEINSFIESLKGKTDIERTAEGKEKNGVEIKGIKAINPANNEEIPVWLADYVLAGYGTGAVMAVPAHDERDWAFSKKYNLEFKQTVFMDGNASANFHEKYKCDELEYIKQEGPILHLGRTCNSGEFSNISSEDARIQIAQKFGKLVTNYKLRDWVFSRQRYWGEPIPLIHCPKCGVVPVPEKDLPLKLPNVKSYEPTGTGESPLAAIDAWVNVKCPVCKTPAKRETNTMPQWAGSCWYYLRFIDPKNNKALVDPKKEKYWQPVDMYVGGAEHATRHLIYARFWHKFLYDIGAVSTSEPFMSLKNQGLIAGPDGRKMSKRYGNVVNPDDIVKLYGADTLRVYEMFMGPFEAGIAWSTDNMIGSRRFIERVYRLLQKVESKTTKKSEQTSNDELESLIHRTIKKVGEDIESFAHNTAISSLMILLNALEKETQSVGQNTQLEQKELSERKISRENYEILLKLLAPFAPYVTADLWSQLGNKKSIHLEAWPVYDVTKLQSSTFKIVVQINSKVRATMTVSDDTEAHVVELALKLDEIVKRLGDTKPTKVIYVKGKLINFVAPAI